jgi:hypothetical protein
LHEQAIEMLNYFIHETESGLVNSAAKLQESIADTHVKLRTVNEQIVRESNFIAHQPCNSISSCATNHNLSAIFCDPYSRSVQNFCLEITVLNLDTIQVVI